MTTEGSSAPSVPEAAGGSLPIANFKALLKDSLSEVLKENPSLLQPRGEAQRGELAASVGEGGKVIYRLCPGVVSEAKWRGCRVLGGTTVARERHRILSGCSTGRGCHVRVSLPSFYSPPPLLSLSPPLSPPPLPPPLSNGGAGATLGEMPDGGVVGGLGLPVISPSEGALGVPVVLSDPGDPGMGETVEGPLVSHAKSGEGGAGEETTLRAKGGEKTVNGPPKPFLLSEGLPPLPAKLVGRIWKGEFIDMAELLRDNLEAQRRGGWQEMPSSSASGLSRQRREVPDLLSCVQCFGVYTAVVASRYPERVQKLLAYQILMVREARLCGGKGWLSYDSYFRQQMAGEWRGDEWGRLNPYLFSSTFLALGGLTIRIAACASSPTITRMSVLWQGKSQCRQWHLGIFHNSQGRGKGQRVQGQQGEGIALYRLLPMEPG